MKYILAFFGALLLAGALFMFSRSPAPHAPAQPAIGDLAVRALSWKMDTYRSGTGPFIALVPSAGREASDFNELAHALNEAGYQTHSFDLPTLSSAIEKNALTEHGLLSYSVPLLTLKDEDVVFIGHAYGNRVVRDAASRHPENVKAVILLAAGG